MRTAKCVCGKEIFYTQRKKNETIQVLKTVIASQKERIKMLESRAAYKEEDIQELKTELQIWKSGCELYEKLIAKLIKKEGVCTNISARPAETFTIPLRKTPNF